ncbi:DEAD/DEAH box helicase [Bacillus sp. V3B]|uniref:DEAD/DEAH box helicase n=1 Tax=Bacillus sp. V3B TaxID=2804915 RepID=UPI00210E416E|nr:DEAD/DEAH box helicase [Bacillus sp. V3B]MCQ6275873.1 DEAD/DEAH box helicase [Bacillus sp. V3B]
MKPERQSRQLLGATRSKAKMNEYGVEEEYHINLSKDPSTLFTLAIGLLGDLSAHLNSENTNEEYVKELRDNLQFSAHFFDAYLQTNLRADLDNYVLLLGSASYYLCDLPGSSLVLVNRVNKDNLNLECSNLDTLLVWLLIGDFSTYLKVIEGTYKIEIQETSKLLSNFYDSGYAEPEIYKAIYFLRNKAYQYGTPRELLFADVISAVVKKRIENSSRKCLPRYSGLNVEDWGVTLRNKNFIQEFWPAQHLLGRNGIFRGESAVVQLPTSAGKTKATEVIIRSAFLSNRTSLAVIVAPFKALCHEISDSLNKSFQNESINIDELSDIPQIDFKLASILRDELILVVTPEKLIYMLRHFPELAERIGLLIYDEGHQFDSGTRGINYELLLTSLKGMVPENVQKVLISAVISNAEIVSSWLNGEESKVVSGINLSPTYRTVALASWLDRLGRLEFVNIENPDEGEFYVPRIIEQQQLQLKGREKNERLFPKKNDGNTISLFLGLKLISNGSVAIFCGKKNSVSSLCEKIVDAYDRGLSLKRPYDFSEKSEIKKLHFLYKCHLGSREPVTKSAELGILTHHGNIPSGIRLAVEHSMKEGLAKFVICTSTLAQGVNLPIRYLIVTSVYQGSEKIKVRDFHNLIGRVGRSGMHTEGSIIFADPSAYDKRNNRREKWRWKQVKELLDPDNSEPVGSSLLKIFNPLYSADKKYEYEIDYLKFFKAYIEDPDKIFIGLEKIATLYAKEGFTSDGLRRQVISKIDAISSIESYLMANWEDITPEIDEVKISTLAKETLAYTLASEELKEQIISLFELLAQNITTKIPENSKRKLFGKMLYGVKVAMIIEEWTTTHLEELKDCNTIEELLDVLWPLLSANINNSIFNKCEKPEVLRDIALGWINGKSYFELLNILKEKDIRISTKKQRRVFKIDHVVEICESAFSYEGMLLIGAVAELTGSLIGIQNENIVDNLKILQKRLKYGLPDSLSVMTYELGFADRIISLDLCLVLKQSGVPKSKGILKKMIKSKEREIREKLSQYPSYFTLVLDNIVN